MSVLNLRSNVLVLFSFLMLLTSGCDWFDDNESPREYTVGGTVTGLTDQLTLQNNGADDVVIAADGVFEFATPMNNGAGYAVTVSTQPDGQSCTVTNAAGSINAADVANVEVSCVDLFTGLFVDDLVLGLDYTCSSGTSSDTTIDGQFTCPEGDDITFWLGSNELGPVPVAYAVISPLLLFPDDGLAAINLARLLQTLDSDQLPDNGVIVIDDALVAALPPDLDFSLQPAEFEAAVGISLVSVETAVQRLRDAIAQYVPENIDPIADAGADRDVTVGAMVTLSGAGSSDANGDGLTFNWTFVSTPAGSGAELAEKFSVAPSFVADVAGPYVVGVLVSDGTVINYDIVVITANDDSALPTAPQALQAVAGDALVALSWSPVDGATGYMIYWNTTGNVTTSSNWTGPITSTVINLGALTNGTTYFYRVAAVNASGEGPMSAEVSATPLAVGGTTNADLVTLSLTSTLPANTLSPAFDSNITSYTATVDNVYSWIEIIPTAADSNATIAVEIGSRTIPVNSGSSSGAIGLEVGLNLMSVVVTAEAGNTKTYSLAVTRLAISNNADLSALVLSDGVLSPVFNATTTAYTTTVASTTDSITVTPYTFDAHSTVTVNGTTVASGATSSAIALSGGENAISVVVTAEDGSTSKTYTVTVTREISTYKVGGIVSGLTGTVTLQNNAADSLDIFANGTFTFATEVGDGAAYDVTVGTQPAGQICSVTNGSGIVSGADVSDVSVNCFDSGTPTTSDWKWANPLPQGNHLGDVAWGNGQYVAVGLYGTVLTSDDGLSWSVGDIGTDAWLSGIVWDETRFVAVGEDATAAGNSNVAISGDGVNWTLQEVGTRYALSDIVWSGSRYVAVGYQNADPQLGGSSVAVSATSTDGATWTTQTHAGYSWDDIAWNESVFAVMERSGLIHTSDDGLNWVTTDVGLTGTSFSAIGSDGGQFVVVGAVEGVYTSPDGLAWTLQPGTSNVTGRSIIWDDNQFVVGGGAAVFTSPDGVTWTVQAPVSTDIEVWTKVQSLNAVGGQYIALGNDGVILSSPDLATWTLLTSGDFTGLQDITWGDNLFVAVGNNKTVRTSSNGISWTTRANINPDWALFGVAWGDGRFVAVGGGDSNQALTSTDGVTWTPQTVADEHLELNSVAWGAGKFVAMGQNGKVFSSLDGITWTAETNGLSASDWFYDISWNGSLFVGVGYSDADPYYSASFVTSQDGITWTPQLLPYDQGAQSVVWGNGRFVAVGHQAILTSLDGLTWTVQRNSMDRLTQVAWTGTQFVATGDVGGATVLTSEDGETWTSQRSISGFYQGIASDGNRTVFVTPWGGILTNDTL